MTIIFICICHLIGQTIQANESDSTGGERTVIGIVEALIDEDNNNEFYGVTVWDEQANHDYLIIEDDKELELRKLIDKKVMVTGTVTLHESKEFLIMKLHSFREIITAQSTETAAEKLK
jgi:hypothetical protein